MLEVKQYKQALMIAVEGGDPNNINKVISEIAQPQTEVSEVIRLCADVPDGLRHLRNFAKKRRKLDLMKGIYEYLSQLKPEQTYITGLQQSEFCEVAEIIKQVYESDNMRARDKLMERAAKNLSTIYKDQFYTKMIGEATEVTKKQL